MVTFIMVYGIVTKDKVKANTLMLTATCMMVCGITIKNMAKAYLHTLIMIFKMATGTKTHLLELVTLQILTVLQTHKAADMVVLCKQTTMCTKVTLFIARNMAKAK